MIHLCEAAEWWRGLGDVAKAPECSTVVDIKRGEDLNEACVCFIVDVVKLVQDC